MCRMHSLVSLINLYASTTFLVALSFDRYLCLVYPVKSRYYRTMKNAIISVAICWAIVLTICVVQIQFRQLMMRVKVPVVNGSTAYRNEYHAAPANECVTMWTAKKGRKNLCFCMWKFPSDQAYFWFRLIAGDVPMMVVLVTYSKIKRTLRPQASIMRELMRTSINQTTVILNPTVAATSDFRRSFHPKANRLVFCLTSRSSRVNRLIFNIVGAVTIKVSK